MAIEPIRGRSSDAMFIFKVPDYTTHMVGRRQAGEFGWIYYVERGDGTCWIYDECRIQWAQRLSRGSPLARSVRMRSKSPLRRKKLRYVR